MPKNIGLLTFIAGTLAATGLPLPAIASPGGTPKIGFVRVELVLDSCQEVSKAKILAARNGEKSIESSKTVLRARINAYSRLLEILKSIAQREGYTAIFKIKPFKKSDRDLEMLNYEIGVRQVLYFSNAVDLSARSLGILDGKEDIPPRLSARVAPVNPSQRPGLSGPVAGAGRPARPIRHPQAVGREIEEVVRTGSAKGRVLFQNKGLEGVTVRIVRIFQSKSLMGLIKETQKGAEFEANTNAEGVFTFRNVPVGAYTLKWLLPGGKAWIRRMKDKPDIIVSEGQTVTTTDIHAGRRVMGQ